MNDMSKAAFHKGEAPKGKPISVHFDMAHKPDPHAHATHKSENKVHNMPKGFCPTGACGKTDSDNDYDGD